MNLLRRSFLLLLATWLGTTAFLLPSHGQTAVSRYRFASASTALPAWSGGVSVSTASIGSRTFLRVNGGIAFGATLTVPRRYEGMPVSLTYEPNRPNGERLVFRVNNESYVVKNVPDHWLAPIAYFADSSIDTNQTLVTLTPPDDEASRNRPLAALHEARLHASVKSRQIGQLLISLDMLFDPNDQSVDGRGARKEFERLVHRQEEADNDLVGSWLIHDVDATISFELQGGEMTLTGLPKILFWDGMSKEESGGDDAAKPAQPLSDEFTGRQAELLTTNPGYQVGVMTMRLAALFRYMKKLAPGDWERFREQLRPVAEAEQAVPTDYVVDTRLEKWSEDYPDAAREYQNIRSSGDLIKRFSDYLDWKRKHPEAVAELQRILSSRD